MMDMDGEPAIGRTRDSSLRDYLRVVSRRKWVIVSAVVLVPLAAVFFSLRQETLYQSHAKVLLSSTNLASALTNTPDQSSSAQPDRVAQTQAQLARVPDVAARTLRRVGVRRPIREFLARSSVSTGLNSDLLDFAVTDHDQTLARRLATAYAYEYTIYRQQLDTGALRRARAEAGKHIQALVAAGDRRSALYQSLVEKEQQLATIEALQTSNASLVQPADTAVRIQPRPTRNGVLGLALGLVLGIGLAFLWEALDTRVRSAEEIAEWLGMPLLARLPEPSRRLKQEEQLAMIAEPHSAGAESFRMLRTNLEFVRLGHLARTIMITSAVEREGKSTTVANLAVALARAGQRVALVDLDLHRPFLGHFFDLGSASGLTEVAIGEVLLDEALTQVAIGEATAVTPAQAASGNGSATVPQALGAGSLSVLAAGTIPPNVGEFVGSEAVASILNELRHRFDTVLVDAPPSLLLGDAMALSANVDAILVICRLNVVRRPMLNELRRLLDASRARRLGFIVAGAEREGGYAYGYAYGYRGRHDRSRNMREPQAGKQT
jgi:succinoglycan biosynthesis transport protein ExoP